MSVVADLVLLQGFDQQWLACSGWGGRVQCTSRKHFIDHLASGLPLYFIHCVRVRLISRTAANEAVDYHLHVNVQHTVPVLVLHIVVYRPLRHTVSDYCMVREASSTKPLKLLIKRNWQTWRGQKKSVFCRLLHCCTCNPDVV